MAGRDRSRLEQAAKELSDLDDSVFRAVAGTNGPVLDDMMPKLTNAADHSKLWLATAAGLAVFGGQAGRRAALRGLCSIGISSLIANQVLKRLFVRTRPDRTLLPFGRNGRRHPSSSSFPSGHAASAAAFAAGASIEVPALSVPLGALAGAVGFSRVATGAHYPSDVIAGFLLGASVAAWGRKVVPVPEDVVRDTTGLGILHVGERPTGAGVVLVVNPASNSGNGARVIKGFRRRLPDARVVELQGGDDWHDVIAREAADAEVLAVAGGDGTVATAAQVALDLDLPLAVLPAGTFNHFARDVQMFPLDAALEAIRTGSATKVDAAFLNDRLFLNTASVGAYTEFVRIRERFERRIGKPAAAVLAALRTVRSRRAMRILVDDVEMKVSLLFAGNGQYLPQGFAPRMRAQLDDGIVDLRTLDFTDGLARWRVIFSLVTGRMARSPYYQVASAAEISIELPDGPQRIARDGELGEEADRLHIVVKRRALTVIRPPHRG